MIIITILSGKGGVGKTTLTVGVALALQEMGYRVAILDLDLENPSMAGRDGVTGLTRRDLAFPGEKILPPLWYGISIMSLSLFPLDDFADTPTMVDEQTKHQIIRQLYKEVDWGNAEVLLIDMPPGSGEEVRGLLSIGPDAAVVVTAPQRISEAAVRRVLVMAEEYGIRVLGLVQNCNNVVGGDAGARLGEAFHLPLLASLEWSEGIPEAMERHEPFGPEPFMPVAMKLASTYLDQAAAPSWRDAPQEVREEAAVRGSDREIVYTSPPPEPVPPDGSVTEPAVPEPWKAFRDLTDEEWAELTPLLPAHCRAGRRRIDDRALMNGILWIFTTRSSWAAMPQRYGNHYTARTRWQRWQKDDIWDPIWLKAKELGYALTEGEFIDNENLAQGILHPGDGAGQQARPGPNGNPEVSGCVETERAPGDTEAQSSDGEGNAEAREELADRVRE